MSTRVLVDANVLYSRTLRDWLALLYLESDSFFSVYWTEDILAEAMYLPDDFFVLVDESAPDIVRAVVSKQQHYWLTRRSRANLPQSLIAAGCQHFADRVRRHLRDIDAQAS